MAITKQDVLEVLGDAKLNWLRFSVGPINVNAFEYEKVADLIASGAIKVVPWEKNYSQYVPLSDTLMTRSGTLDLQGRTNIVHECTHAISDINEVNVTRLTDETAAYLAQMAYLLLLDPDQPEPPYGGPPVYNVMRQGMKLVKKYQLGQPTGQGATISHSDITEYGHMIHAVPDYSFSESQKLDVDGVSLTDDQAKKLIDVQLGRLFDRQMAQE